MTRTLIYLGGRKFRPINGGSDIDLTPGGPALPPSAVSNLQVSAMSASQIGVSWDAATDPNPGGVIVRYQVYEGSNLVNGNVTGTSTAVSGLQPETGYTIGVEAVNDFELVGPRVTGTATTLAETPYDADIGVIGNRPALSVRPDATNTGPRQPPIVSYSGTNAVAAALAAPVEADGRRYLRRASITGRMTFALSSHANIVFEDCYIYADSSYVINTFTSGEPAGNYPEFRFCDISGGTSSTIYGGWCRFLRCNMHTGVDIIKLNRSNMEVYACYMHDNWHPAGAHCDMVQIRNGGAGSLFHWNNMLGYLHPDSPAPGTYSSGVLQTGSVTGPIGPVEWRNNWWEGGQYTIRGTYASDPCIYLFRDNRWGRPSGFGPITSINHPTIDFDDSNVWDDTGLPVTGP